MNLLHKIFGKPKKLLEAEIKILEQDLAKCQEEIGKTWELRAKYKKEIDGYNSFLATVKKLSKDSKFKHQVLLKDQNHGCDIFVVLKVFKGFDKFRNIQHFNLILYDFTNARQASFAEVKIDFDNNEIKLSWIETKELYAKQGLGSFLLSYLKEVCKCNNHVLIRGSVHLTPNIGRENLKHFYLKNDFAIIGNGFVWENADFIER